ncbi:MAG: CBS domain-containing protein [Planctomycetota bacterium]
MTVETLCTKNVDVARVDEPVWVAAERMVQRTVGTLVVVNGDQQPLGILTDRDIVVRVVAARRDPRMVQVGEIMTPNPRMVRTDSRTDAALEIMREGGHRRVIVVDERGVLFGLLSLDDVLMKMASSFRVIYDLLQRKFYS